MLQRLLMVVLGLHEGLPVLLYFGSVMIMLTADPDLLRQICQLLQEKNQILRTRLVKHNDQVLQVVVSDTIQWGSGYSLGKYKASDMSKRVGLGDSLFRYAIVREGDRSFFVWICHHSGFDGWTRRLIMDQLQEGFIDMVKLRSEPQSSTYKSFVDWKHSQSDKRIQAIAFWKQYLAAGFKCLEGVHRPRLDYVPLGSSEIAKRIETKAVGTKTIGTNSFVTLSTIGYASWALAIGSLWGVEDILFATMRMGRQMARDSLLYRVESIMGPTIAVTPVRVGLCKDMTIGDFLQQMQSELISTVPYEHEGWSGLVDFVGAGATLPGMIDWHPLGSDLFSRTLRYKTPSGEEGYLKPRRDLSVNLTTNLSMLVDIYEHEHHLDLRVTYDANIWEKKLVRKLVDTFTTILAKVLYSGDRKVGELLQGGGMTRLKARL